MSLNKVKKGSNMYQGWLTHTWNTVKGKCPHGCNYCYMKGFPLKSVRFDEKELNQFDRDMEKIGEGQFIFVGSSCDMFARNIPFAWIEKTINHCKRYDNTYLFQSKNPSRFIGWANYFPVKTIIGTTMETNRNTGSNAPEPFERALKMSTLKHVAPHLKRMITIEPIMDFDLNTLAAMVKTVAPEWVNIGADSKGHNLPEPTCIKINQLIYKLTEFTLVKCKKNLMRLV